VGNDRIMGRSHDLECVTPFSRKTVQRDKKEQSTEKQYNCSIEKREGRSIGLTNGQRSLTLSIDGLASQIDQPMVNQGINRWDGRRR
jgi:hypothetical protein